MTCKHGTKDGYPCEHCYFGVSFRGLVWLGVGVVTFAFWMGVLRLVGIWS